MLKKLRADLVREGCLGALESGPTVEEPGVLATAARGGEYKDVLDRVTGEELDGAGVARARGMKYSTCVRSGCMSTPPISRRVK